MNEKRVFVVVHGGPQTMLFGREFEYKYIVLGRVLDTYPCTRFVKNKSLLMIFAGFSIYQLFLLADKVSAIAEVKSLDH